MLETMFRDRARFIVLFALILMFISEGKFALADDGIFPPAPSAKAFIDFDGKGFLINGKREFIASGTLHYPRVPRALWRDRLLKIKRAGFNCVETYAFWNYHESQEGKWDFSGEKDFGAFLALIHELGMHSIVRLGPYVCAEWDSGGFPVWLKFKPGVKVREDNPQYLSYVDKWLEKITPIIAKNQIHRGGSVILVQLENEHPQGWGKEMPNGYFKHLQAKALALGIEVPYFFSGLHHGGDPASGKPWDSKGRTNPWFSTEFWPGWYDLYGNLDDARYWGFVQGFWRVLSHGGNGVNFYMLHGGTNFETWNNDETSANYDYAAAIGQAGDLRRMYYSYKRIATFARSFPDILEDSENVSDQYQDFDTEHNMTVSARKSPAGTLVFLESHSRTPLPVRLKDDRGIELPRAKPMLANNGEVLAILKNYKILPEVTLNISAARIMGITRQGDWTTLMTFGTPLNSDPATAVANDTCGEMDFSIPAEGFQIVKNHVEGAFSPGLERDPADAKRLTLKISYPNEEVVNEYIFSVGVKKVRILAMARNRMHLSWMTIVNGKNYLLSGMDYPGEIVEKDGKLHVQIETGLTHVLPHPETMLLFGGEGESGELATADERMQKFLPQFDAFGFPTSLLPQLAPPQTPWEVARADVEAATNYFAGKWRFAIQPEPMGADGDFGAYAWYRVNMRAPAAGKYTLNLSDVGDWATVFLNGAHVRSTKPEQRNDKPISRQIPVALKAGENTLAILTAHNGRNKLFNFLGAIDKTASKGLSGLVTLSKGEAVSQLILAWKWKRAEIVNEKAIAPLSNLSVETAAWETVKIGVDVFNRKRGYAWYYAELPAQSLPHRRLSFEGVDDNCTVFVNGKRLLDHKGYNDAFGVNLDSIWNAKGKNELLVLVQNTDGPGGITGAVTLTGNSPIEGTPVTGWRMRGGLTPVRNERDWKPLDIGKGAGVPAFYRTTFILPPTPAFGARPTFRLSTVGLSHGFVFVNGHNVGRYPEKAQSLSLLGVYLPECWLKEGKNTVTIFDEEGATPVRSSVIVEQETSKYALELVGSVK